MTVESEFNVDAFGDIVSVPPTRSLTSSSSRQFLRGMANTPFRKASTAQQPPPLLSANEPPMVWYTQCVSQLLFPQLKAVALRSADINVSSVRPFFHSLFPPLECASL